VPTNIITDTSVKILEMVELNDDITIPEIVTTIGISEQSVERNQYWSPKMKGGFC